MQRQQAYTRRCELRSWLEAALRVLTLLQHWHSNGGRGEGQKEEGRGSSVQWASWAGGRARADEHGLWVGPKLRVGAESWAPKARANRGRLHVLERGRGSKDRTRKRRRQADWCMQGTTAASCCAAACARKATRAHHQRHGCCCVFDG